MINSQPISLYFHIPFCLKKCNFCDFNSYPGKENLIPVYVESLIQEMTAVVRQIEGILDVHTIYFGGGTPSLISVSQFGRIFDSFSSLFNILPEAEISLEVNPGTVNQKYLIGLRKLGFNRVSIGVQSTIEKELKFLGRIHDREDIFNSVRAVRIAKFSNLNLDLIYGLPEQSVEEWKSSLNEVINLDPEHVSLYSLTIEERTPFGARVKKGLMEPPSEDLAAEMFNWSERALEKSGFQQYEISNWSKKGFECQHNLQTWRNKQYLGFGAGAHGFYGELRVSNALRISDYMERVADDPRNKIKKKEENFPISPAIVTKSHVNRFVSMQETLMLGLRLIKEGVRDQDFYNRYGIHIEEVFEIEIKELIQYDLLEWHGGTLKLTNNGRLLGNQVFIRFVS